MTQRSINLFLQRLKELRKEAGLTQQDIAAKLGLNQATYSAMERGSQSILLDYLFQIAEALQIPIWQMLADPNEAGAIKKNDKNFFDMWIKFSPTEREVLKLMADQIMQKKVLEELRASFFVPENVSQVS